MGRVKQGSIVVCASGCRGEELISIFRTLGEVGINSVRVSVKPGYIYGRISGASRTQQYAVPPFSLIIEQPSKNIVEVLASKHECLEIYTIDIDSWIDTAVLSITGYLDIYAKINRVVEECGEERIEYNHILLDFGCEGFSCRDIYVFDYINAPYSWAGRILPFNNVYREVLRKASSEKLMKRLLCYAIDEKGEYIEVAVLEVGKTKYYIKINISKNCQLIKEYIAWLLLDLLLG